MPKRSSKPRDLNSLAARIVGEATDAHEVAEVINLMPAIREKNAAAVELGRRGGLKGGSARAASLPPEERSRIASEAAKKRWGDKSSKD